MSEANSVDCPHCGELVPAGEHCEECGGALANVLPRPAPLPESEMTQVPFATRSESIDSDQAASYFSKSTHAGSSDVDDLRDAKKVLHDPKASLPKSEVKPASMTPHSPVAHADSGEDFDDDCPHFRLEFNDARIFVQGWTTSFNFRVIPISPDSGHCKMTRLEVRIHGESPKTQSIWGFRQRRAQEVDFNFSPQSLGFEIVSDVCLTYQLNGQSHTYMGTFKWDAVRPEESSKVIENLVIKMENVEAGMAADQNINILKDFKARQTQSLSSRLQDLKLKPVWKPLELFDASDGSPAIPENLSDRLTLLGPGEMRLHLLGGNRFSMGRAAGGTCDIVTLLFRGADQADTSLSARNGISRFQAHLVHRNGQWMLRDGGIDPSASLSRVKPSSYGTYLNGQKLESQAITLTPGKSQNVSFGRANFSEKNVFAFEATVLCDPENEQTSALLLERMDSVRESFLCVAGRIDLEDLLPGSGGGTLRFRQGGFKLKKAGEDVWLVPGASVNRSWDCEQHRQLGF